MLEVTVSAGFQGTLNKDHLHLHHNIIKSNIFKLNKTFTIREK